MRINELLGRDEPTFSFEFFPPKTPEGEENFKQALKELAPLEPSFVSVTYGAGGTTREQDRRDRAPHQGGRTAWRRWRTSPASAPRPTSCASTLEEIREAGIDNVLALRGDPPRGQTEWIASEGGLEYSHQLVVAAARGLRLRDRRRVLPRDAHPRDLARGRPALPQGQGRRRRRLPHHAVVLRQRSCTTTSSTARGRSGSRSRSSRGSCRSPATARSRRSPGCAARRCPSTCSASSTRARTTRRPSRSSASPTRRCSAPTCWPTARRASTSAR